MAHFCRDESTAQHDHRAGQVLQPHHGVRGNEGNPGQSGDVNDPHYRDLYELWARGKYFPIFYSRPKIESVAERVWSLKPASRTGGSAEN